MFTKSHRRTASGIKRIDITLNVEELTAEERLSRSLHTHSRRLSNATERPRIFEWFLVIGVDETSINNNAANGNGAATPTTSSPTLLSPSPPSLSVSGHSNSSSNSNSSTPTGANSPRPSSPSFFSFVKPSLPHSPKPSEAALPPPVTRYEPKILYKYPPDKSLGSINVESFPFPSGVAVSQQSQTASHTNLFQLLYTQHHLKEPEDSFVFMLTDERKEVLYGCSTMKVAPVSKKMDRIDIDEEPEEGETTIETGDTIKTAPKCYVILSKYPFFPLHFNIINGILAIMHMQEISRFQNVISAKRLKAGSGSSSLSLSKDRAAPPSSSSSSLQQSTAGTTITVNSVSNDTTNGNGDGNDGNRSHSNSGGGGGGSNNNSPTSISVGNNNKNQSSPQQSNLLTIPVPKIEITTINEIGLEEKLKIDGDELPPSLTIQPTPAPPPPSIQQHHFQSRLQIKEPIKDLVEYYYNHLIPLAGQTISFNVPNLDTTISFRRSSQRPRNGVLPEPNSDFNDLCLEYGLFLTVQLLSHKTLLVILSAILLEKRIVFYSKSLRNLTSVIFSTTSLLKPFTYQSVLLPIIPDSLKDVLSAPVPFICGVNTMPNASEIDYKEVLLVDIDSNKIQTNMPPVIIFPGWKALANQLIEMQRQLKNTLEAKKQLNYVANELQEALLDVFAHAITNHFDSLFTHFKRHCIKDVSNPKKIVSVFIPETFLVEYDDDPEEKEWITQFMRTQIFKVFEDKTLRNIDGDLVQDIVDENNMNNNSNSNSNSNSTITSNIV